MAKYYTVETARQNFADCLQSYICVLLARNWDFRDALVESTYVFSGIFYEFVNKNKKRYTLKRLKVETSNLHLGWGTYESFLVQILGKSIMWYGFLSQKLKLQLQL